MAHPRCLPSGTRIVAELMSLPMNGGIAAGRHHPDSETHNHSHGHKARHNRRCQEPQHRDNKSDEASHYLLSPRHVMKEGMTQHDNSRMS
jgi:hypothetical protein